MSFKYLINFFLTIFFLINAYATAKDKKIIKVGYFVAPTFIYENDHQQLVGPLYAFFRNIESISDFQFMFEKYTNSRMYHEIELGHIQMMAMSAKQLENEYIINSEIPFMKDKPYLVARSDFSLNKITSVKQLENLTIGIKQDGAISDFLLKNKDKLKFETSASTESVYLLLLKLLGKRVDLIHGYSSHIFGYLARKNKISDKIKLIEIPGEYSTIYFGFSKKLDIADRDKLNKLIKYLLLEKKINLTEQIKNWND
ncbi:transporter substrate-binding domain-containing protein [Pigmentibacter sp. JX0631]|uniref:transporter substrate-binding domain-containing protein n=1 Tax=Pigmentibacter sp. JX0631 TaxID=2976982 RepID=UPI0024685BB6|nr:transporter substrate-binding domain-containing protein [Pigmentibacter sp. JX0631]WGL61108.1 transporter substrate-binding domain-containing protein [Pigmentibacter sp. JX0631]